ncbi:PepSY domain-containing protein [Sporosarcina gallistercoris]|uniref:PepSY domain-containing protein n=1 Tax=Sporosarcina gallistercoris TaxID=2762245 RepID=A0ABR8PJT5_9BACL|nr:PepSY domain-containing protein [Sporosarcina gallistercoris]MBD7908428.1 hypothetical protein [Sporosarcina gallistercoris]
MKRILLTLCAITLFGFVYSYQKPIIETNQAIHQAKQYLVAPPEEWKVSFSKVEDEIVPWEVNRTELTKQQGFFWGLMNKRKWEVEFKYESQQVTVLLNAYTGEFVGIYGPLN